MSSREQILGRLRQAKRPFPTISAPKTYLPMVPIDHTSPAALYLRFTEEVQKAGAVLHEAMSEEAALEVLLKLIGQDTAVSCWEPEQIPLSGLAKGLDKANVQRVGQDASVRIGITGVDAGLAATGSVVLMSGNGRYRSSSLLPPIHIAIMHANQILPDLESWFAQQKQTGLEKTRQHSNIVVISGPSRTADIAMQLVMGMHGPREMHVIVLNN